MLFWPSEENFWPLTASITLEVKNDCVLVTMEGVLNKISRIKFSVGCRVWLWCRIFQVPRSLKILIRYWLKLLSMSSWLISLFSLNLQVEEIILQSMLRAKRKIIYLMGLDQVRFVQSIQSELQELVAVTVVSKARSGSGSNCL